MQQNEKMASGLHDSQPVLSDGDISLKQNGKIDRKAGRTTMRRKKKYFPQISTPAYSLIWTARKTAEG